MIQALESRVHFTATLANGVLTLEAVAGNSFYLVGQSDTLIVVDDNILRQFFDKPQVTRIEFNGGDGADTVHLSDALGTPAVLRGNGGDDTFFGGAGDDLLDGGTGTDSLFGSGGADTLLTRDGAEDSADGGAGADTFDADPVDTLTAVETPLGPAGPPGAAPRVSVADGSAAEGAGTVTLTVTLSQSPQSTVTVPFATAPGSASADDYQPTSGTLTFTPGGPLAQQITVTLFDDAALEGNQTFSLNLTAATGAALADGQAQVTILDDDGRVIPFGGKTKATYTDADGGTVTVSLKGPGQGSVLIEGPGTGNADASRIVVEQTTGSSSLSLKGVTSVGGVAVDGSLKSLAAKSLALNGDLTVSGAVRTLQLGDVSGGQTLTIGAGTAAALTLGQVSDLSVVSGAPLRSVKAAAWLDGDANPDRITAPSLALLSVRGGFAADVLVTGALGKVSVGGALTGADLRAASIGAVTVGTADGSRVFAGVGAGLSDLPDSSDDFDAAAGGIKSFAVKGKGAGAFRDTRVAGRGLGKLSLGDVTTANGGNAFGVAAETIRSITFSSTAAGAVKRSRLDAPADSLAEQDFVVRLL